MTQLFRRNRPDDGAQTPTPAPAAAPEVTTSTGIPCKLAGCTNDTAQPCAYRDGRGRACAAAYCPEHGVATEGKFYCRRHAGVLRAVGAEVTPQGGLPDIDNRAPSLVSWIARDLDAAVRRVLAGGGVIADGVPPWIVHRTTDTDMATDLEQRERFYQWLDESIFLAVDRF